MERRYLQTHELRLAGGNKPQISGYAARYNVTTKLPKFREVIAPGAFTRALREKQDTICCFNHDPNFVLGRTSSGTLRLSEDARGLKFTCDLPDTQAARDLRESINRRDINGCSFAFNIADEDWSEGKEDNERYLLRSVKDLDLIDVSPVTHPAYPETSVSARELELVGAEIRSRVKAVNPADKLREQIASVMAEAQERCDEIDTRGRRRRLLIEF
jgi:hypothetical protein